MTQMVQMVQMVQMTQMQRRMQMQRQKRQAHAKAQTILAQMITMAEAENARAKKVWKVGEKSKYPMQQQPLPKEDAERLIKRANKGHTGKRENVICGWTSSADGIIHGGPDEF